MFALAEFNLILLNLFSVLITHTNLSFPENVLFFFGLPLEIFAYDLNGRKP